MRVTGHALRLSLLRGLICVLHAAGPGAEEDAAVSGAQGTDYEGMHIQAADERRQEETNNRRDPCCRATIDVLSCPCNQNQFSSVTK
jgi:hypothetical protein